MGRYKSREYCESINCPVQSVIYKEDEDSFNYNKAKEFCRDDCKAYDFHKWLGENNYQIVKDLDFVIIVLREWFDEMENRLNDELEEDDFLDIGLNEPLENIANCIYDLEGKLEKDLREIRGGE